MQAVRYQNSSAFALDGLSLTTKVIHTSGFLWQCLCRNKPKGLIVGIGKGAWIKGLGLSLLLMAQPCLAQDAVMPDQRAIAMESGFRVYLSQVRQRALNEGVSVKTVDTVLPSISYNERVVRLDRSQPEGATDAPVPNFAPYKARHVDSSRINRGRSKYAELRPMLGRIETETGVPEEMMIAIYGHETNYGTVTGNYNAPEALASLAFEGRRRNLFEAELIAVLKMIDRGVPQYAITGSWAGALGKPQFLPSVYLRLARDGDGDGYADIWKSEVDAMTSIANYFVKSGWRRDEEWGFAVTIPASFDRTVVKSLMTSPRCPRVFARHSKWLSIAEWRQLGVTPERGFWPKDSMLATLIEPDGPGKTAYLLGGNYRVILDYNCSNFYALSVGLLADEVRK
jgi:membrane-bound lytic murein transglycosylase B